MGQPLRVIYGNIKAPSPRVRMAMMLYETGTVKTKREAARLAGITEAHFYNMTNLNPPTRQMSNEIQSMIQDESVNTSKVLQVVSRKAIGRLAQLMDSDSETIAFRAAQDLADRGPETQKTQRVQVDSLSLTGEDAKAIAAAMVESAQAHSKFSHVAQDGLIEVDTDKAGDTSALRLMPAEE